MQWMLKEGVVCNSCKKNEKKCFWRMESGWGTVCLTCYSLKKVCEVVRVELIEAKSSPPKRRKMESKGKTKAKVGAPVSGVLETTVVDVLRDILLELKEL